jgi:uncharacterized protein (UPF0335 family)
MTQDSVGIGHNSNTVVIDGDKLAKLAKKTSAGGISADRLKSFVERIERLEEEQKSLAEDKRDIYSEAKGVGYDVKTIRKVVALRKMDAADRDEANALLDTYCHALGVFG